MTDSRSRWIDTRDAWLRDASDKQVLDVVAKVAGGYMFDEIPGETIERTQTILWLASRGQLGAEWGHAAEAARTVGGWEESRA